MKEVIRIAVNKDSSRIIELLNSEKMLTSNDNLIYNKGHIYEIINGSKSKTFVYVIDKKIVGLINFMVYKLGRYAEFYIIIIDNKYRKKGIARKLYDFAEDKLRKSGINLIYGYTLENNNPMQIMLEKLNFDKGKKHYFYSKVLK
ncbi:hypothetical protein COU57_02815 [Candidatus Pacearchaeota archaeon CG10_big_fil_rev_8_21_14_0_10_32_14]|nr:MAG: hypothetical protein COU57_02815 [Candidatus Pacearchaeota archaeon CG10_big_fil_rev_8_21_14_0_10_32_14]